MRLWRSREDSRAARRQLERRDEGGGAAETSMKP
jgi:hypothetical protein